MTVAPPTQVLRAARAVRAILKAQREAEIAAPCGLAKIEYVPKK